SIINSKPVLRFSGNTFIDPGALGIAGTGSFTYFVVVGLSSYTAGALSDGAGDYILDRTTGTNELAGLKVVSSTKYGFQKRDNSGAGLGGPTSTTSVSTSTFQTVDYLRERGTAYRIYVDGTLENSVADANGDLTPPTTRIGRHATTANGGFKGDMAELIIYNYRVNNAQLNIVNSYLAAKYNLTIANDKFSYDATNGTDVAGIGREDASNLHTSAQSAGLLTVSGASALSDADYLLFGHDAGSIASWTTTEAPNSGTNIQRLAREWKFSHTGNVGTVDFTLEAATLPALPATYTKYVLMVDADGDFSSGATSYEMPTIGGTQYKVTGITISDGNYVCIGVVRPVVEFSSSTSAEFETSSLSVAVSLNYVAATVVTVDYTVVAVTATGGGTDYTLANGTLNIPAGSSSANITPAIVNDAFVELDETFTITLSNPLAGINLGTTTVNTYTIHDDDNARKIDFTAASSNASEATTAVSLTLQINAVDATNPTTVDYSVTGGTATGGGTDYTLASGTATVAINTTTVALNFTVNNDALYEANETIIITLTNPTNSNLGTNYVYTYTINDNDPAPSIQFNLTSSTGSEATTPATFQVDLSAVSGLAATVNYTLTGTATGGGLDYTLANGTLTIAAGSASGTISDTVIDDATVEFSETIILTLSAPVNSTLGANTVHTYTITDNDVFGYVGPGGVGKSTNNALWVKADSKVYSDAGTTPASNGSTVQQWNDMSGNANNVSQGTAGNRPTYKTNKVNGKPALQFTGNMFMAPGAALGIAGTGSFTYFIVLRDTSYSAGATSDGSGDYILDRTTGTNELASLKVTNTSKFGFQKRDNSGSGLGGPQTTTSINTAAYQLIDYMRERAVTYRIYLNGTMEASSADADGDLTPPTINIGRHAATASAGIKGFIAELAIYGTALNTAQRIIVENYLASKYGISILAASDKYAYDAGHGNDVAGIGRENSTNYHTDAQGSSQMRMNSASSMDDGDYLLWGHDNATETISNTTDIPAGINNRLNRVWRADKTGDVGTITLSCDLNGSTISSGNDLELLIDADGVFAAGATRYTTGRSYNAGTKTVTFTGVNFTDGDYFTIGSTNAATVLLPIELISFSASPEGDKVKLEWVTATETNNAYFTIERTSDAKTFETVAVVKGAGNSSHENNYIAYDERPLKNLSYYRLKQTDFDGKYTYSKLVPVVFSTRSSSTFIIFPNPVRAGEVPSLLFNVNKTKDVLVVVSDIKGREIFSKISIVEKGDDQVVAIDPSNTLPAGVYVISASSDNSIYRQKLIIR
ncbi:MAG: T9SS type A sorting domain-containing protein, partial [Bacteroidia bacterium]|nr:T9SS type A sorting domain-containing protein [Bacteroidia bacterium]